MNLDRKQFEAEVAGQKVIFEVSKIAGQASAAVVGQYGDTVVLATVVMDKIDKAANYMPLVVDYEEKFYAVGKILGSRFMRREGRTSEEGTLSARLVDRTIRPLFDQRMRRGIQVIITVLSYDGENDPDFIALMSASLALAISDIPWNGPVGGVRVALSKDGKIIINPTNSQMVDAKFKTIIAGPKGKINMIELEGSQTQEDEVLEAFKLATNEISKLVDFQNDIVKQIGKKKVVVPLAEPEVELKAEVLKYLSDKLEDVVYVKEKIERQTGLFDLIKELKDVLAQKGFVNLTLVDNLVDEAVEKVVRENILKTEKRPDFRKLDEVRPLYAEVSLFKRLHGSAIFVRGNTQSLAITTLAAPGSEQLIETMRTSTKRRFLLHYNFPPFSVGETGPLRGPGRRDIGHGALAEKAVRNLLPSQEEFPYIIRVVSEILSSNGSSSMATVCATCLSLMDAGVPIKNPAAGIAMGLITDGKENKVLTDIQGPEDHFGDMDCKVAGTKEGITAIQMDTKVEGLSVDVLEKVLIQAKKARLEILDVMTKTLDKPRAELSVFAPTVLAHTIFPDQIRDVIGPGGRVINGIIDATGAAIEVEQTGKVFVTASSKEKAEEAMNQIKNITRVYKIGEIVEGEVIKILDFGAIVGFNGKDGLLHISEMKDGFVKKTEDVVKLGDKLRAKIIKVDDEGRLGLTLKNIEQKND